MVKVSLLAAIILVVGVRLKHGCFVICSHHSDLSFIIFLFVLGASGCDNSQREGLANRNTFFMFPYLRFFVRHFRYSDN